MKTEKSNLSEFEPFLPCSRVVNGFRLIPFFTLTNKVAWVIRPNRSSYRFAFSSFDGAKRFAKSYSNCHSDSFWFKKFCLNYSIYSVSSFLDAMSFSEVRFNVSYQEKIFNNVNFAFKSL